MEDGFTRQVTKQKAMQGDERRRTGRLLRYWEQQKSDKDMPGEDDLDIFEIDDLMDYCFLIQIRDIAENHYNYTYIGSKIVESYGSGDLAGLIPGLVTTDAEHLSSEYHGVIALKEPMITEGEHAVPSGVLKYRQCLLPLSNPEGKVTAILGHMSYKIYPRS